MPTTRQMIRKPKRGGRKHHRKRSPAMTGHPQLKGTVLWCGIRRPRKPNSAQRKVARVRLSTGKVVVAFIPGEKHYLAEHSIVLVRGGRVRDLPGVRYHIIRGNRDATPVEDRCQARSKYGKKKHE